MKNLRRLLAVIIISTLVISFLSMLLPKPADAEVRQYYSPIATTVTLIDVLLALGSAVLFLLALPNFKKELKPAYRLMAFSTIAVGVLLIMFPYIEYYGLWDVLFWNIASYAQYLIGAPLMYFGVRMFYKRLGLGGWVSSVWVIIGIIAVLKLVHAFLPHFDVWPQFSELGYDLFETVTILPLVVYAAALYMVFRVRKLTGQDYKTAFTWLTIGLAFYVFNTAGIVVLETIGYENWYFNNRIYTYPAIAGDLSLVFAGYCFAAIGRKTGQVGAGEAVSSIDIVTYVAQMASDQSKIDPYLDTLRIVTASVGTSRSLTDSDQAKLKEVYVNIENYLVSQDALRDFSKEQLRQNVSTHFGLDKTGQTTFWSTL